MSVGHKLAYDIRHKDGLKSLKEISEVQIHTMDQVIKSKVAERVQEGKKKHQIFTSKTWGSLRRNKLHKTRSQLYTWMLGPQIHNKGTAHVQSKNISAI